MLNLPTITRAELRLRNQIARKGEQPASLSFADADWQLLLSAVPPTAGPVFHASLEIDGQPAWVGISDLLLQAAIRSCVADANIVDLPEALRGLLVEAALEKVLALWERRLGKRLALGEVGVRPAPAGGGIGLACQLVAHGERIGGQVWFSNPWLPFVTQLVDALPDATGNGWEELPVPIRFELGRSRLGLADLRDLTRDDLILIEQGAWPRDRTVSVRIGPDLSYRGTLEQRSVIVQQRETAMAETVSERQEHAQLDELPVTVTFDLGESTLALRELKALQPGYAFELARGLDQPVTIRANGAALGAGELIQVGEYLGVRVVELFARVHG